jgi:hypothetical protein
MEFSFGIIDLWSGFIPSNILNLILNTIYYRCPFVIRYDWFATKGVLKQNTSIVPGAKAAAPALTDWQIVNAGQKGELRAVTVGQRDPIPDPPPETSFVLSTTSLPPPAVLIPAIFYVIRRKLLFYNYLILFIHSYLPKDLWLSLNIEHPINSNFCEIFNSLLLI